MWTVYCKKYDYVDNNNNIVKPTTTTTTTTTTTGNSNDEDEWPDERERVRAYQVRLNRRIKRRNQRMAANRTEAERYQLNDSKYKSGWRLWKPGKPPPKNRLWVDEYIASLKGVKWQMKGTPTPPQLKGKENVSSSKTH